MKTFKVICLLPFVFLLTSLSPNQVKPTDTIPERIEIRAKQLTDKQIDSIYQGKIITPLVDAFRNNFLEIRNLLDSQNKEMIIQRNERKITDFKRDSIANDNTNKLYDALLINREISKQNRVFITLPSILMIILTLIYFQLILIGVRRGLKNETNNGQ